MATSAALDWRRQVSCWLPDIMTGPILPHLLVSVFVGSGSLPGASLSGAPLTSSHLLAGLEHKLAGCVLAIKSCLSVVLAAHSRAQSADDQASQTHGGMCKALPPWSIGAVWSQLCVHHLALRTSAWTHTHQTGAASSLWASDAGELHTWHPKINFHLRVPTWVLSIS